MRDTCPTCNGSGLINVERMTEAEVVAISQARERNRKRAPKRATVTIAELARDYERGVFRHLAAKGE